ncbi:putative bifunctional diguanylate cyclase/phosphodiesterase [Alteromonas flava]|uniref:putative bifunctional diguanylate cyclase/phosphodiesterase n=1 Tax=Alteromonas flava TaxID=2048003 RepID=UPI000C28C489|nr:EAL domain-containing protein [Alteromonas flava]
MKDNSPQVTANGLSLDQQELTGYLYSHLLNGVLITGITYFSLIFLFAGEAPTYLRTTLAGAMGGVLLLRLIDWLYWRVNQTQVGYSNAAKLRFKCLATCTALLWAGGAVVLFNYQNIEERYFTLLALGSMTGGAVIVLSASRYLSLLFPTCLLLPISLVALSSSEGELFKVGVLGLIYWLLMINVSRRAAEITRQSVLFKNQQVTLRRQIESERNELAKAYSQLRQANQQLDEVNLTLEDKVAERTKAIETLSNLDPLTNLLNRTAFSAALTAELNSASEQAILFVDLNGFKSINDALGHHVGDLVLQEIAQRLDQIMLAGLLCRWGGDEFVIALPYAERERVQKFAQRILDVVSEPLDIAGNSLNTDASIGISLFPEHDDSPTILVQKADVAMYKLKREQGEGVLFYDSELKSEVVQEQKLIAGLKQSIKQHQVFMVYQPIVYAEGGDLWGVEALVRWQFYTDLVRPNDFIPLAEKTGFILELGLWVLEQSCVEVLQQPLLAGKHLSVNVSPRQLSGDQFLPRLKQVLTRTGFQAQQLHLEITETALMENQQHILHTLNEIRALGVGLSIDDFGTGYSNFTQLTRLPATTIKIDKAFVDPASSFQDVIVRASLFIAREFKYQTVAEGVETEAQVNYLRDKQVTLLQGYYFAKPMPADEFPQWYAEYSKGLTSAD